MFISVVIPLYNKEATVSRAIQSVLNQTHQDLEIIIVDDGSTDRSLDEAKKHNDSRIKIIEQPNKGVSVARNVGMRHTIAEWVAFLDADDEYMPRFIECIVSFIEQHKSHPISFVASNQIYGNSGLPAFLNVNSGVQSYFKLCKFDRTPAHSSSTVVRREVFVNAGGFPEGTKQFEDWVLWCKLAWMGQFGFIADPLSFYHIAKEGTASTSKRNVKDFFIDIMTLPDIIRKWILNSRIHDDLVSDSWRYVNAFIIGQVQVLRRMNEKRLALRLLCEINIRYFDSRLLLMFSKTILLLILPIRVQKAIASFRTVITSKV